MICIKTRHNPFLGELRRFGGRHRCGSSSNSYRPPEESLGGERALAAPSKPFNPRKIRSPGPQLAANRWLGTMEEET
jgi:hypothetical protein